MEHVCMKVFITGAHGMLAHDIIRVLEGSHQLILTDLADLDICNPRQTAELLAMHGPDCVINCAAYTNVDGCETDSDNAFAVNAAGAKNLALACRQSGAKLVHISTDYVFDGAGQRPYIEDDAPNPLSVYGTSKLAGERCIQEVLDDHVIVRTEWLYGRQGKHFVGRILQLARERDVLDVVDDQTGSPTCTADLALAIEALLAIPARGIYHVTNAGSCSWYEFAQKILAVAGSPTRVLPIASERLARPARRPAYSVLDCSKFTKETGHVLRPWEQALEHYMQEQAGQ
jgi:dTDP-4-dehydrorhamnose reductase